jgi:nucleotide-binding universal stress UspA family protein
VKPDFRVAVGHPSEQILYHADELHADHIVLGHRGKNAFKRWLMGSVSHRVISYATSAVTIIR